MGQGSGGRCWGEAQVKEAAGRCRVGREDREVVMVEPELKSKILEAFQSNEHPWVNLLEYPGVWWTRIMD